MRLILPTFPLFRYSEIVHVMGGDAPFASASARLRPDESQQPMNVNSIIPIIVVVQLWTNA